LANVSTGASIGAGEAMKGADLGEQETKNPKQTTITIEKNFIRPGGQIVGLAFTRQNCRLIHYNAKNRTIITKINRLN
jgi:hypothetical protein